MVAALRATVPAGVYDVVDDEPLPRCSVAESLAAAVDRRHLWRVPAPLVRLMMPAVFGMLGLSLRVSNRRFNEASGWSPTVPDARAGLRRLATTGRPALGANSAGLHAA